MKTILPRTYTIRHTEDGLLRSCLIQHFNRMSSGPRPFSIFPLCHPRSVGYFLGVHRMPAATPSTTLHTADFGDMKGPVLLSGLFLEVKKLNLEAPQLTTRKVLLTLAACRTCRAHPRPPESESVKSRVVHLDKQAGEHLHG